ncbi:MAG TPA: hypothetical protein P5057_08230 [Acidobacteriota bacterium]|jgi:hypothetical protein|nr:hypothetical protein [Acidobacteriota bacterium]
MRVRLVFAIYVLYCIEVGLFLIVFPWMELWWKNPVLDWLPGVRPWVLSPWVRGAVSGLGVANLIVAVAEIAEYVRRRCIRTSAADTADSVRNYG